MAGGKGKSTGGKAGPKEAAGKSQKSHSAKAGLQVRSSMFTPYSIISRHLDASYLSNVLVILGMIHPLCMDIVCCMRCQMNMTYLCGNTCTTLTLTTMQRGLMTTSKCLLILEVVPMRSCEAFLEEQYSEQDARWCQR